MSDTYTCPASIQDGIITLEDGTVVDLFRVQAALNQAFQETGDHEFMECADEMAKLTGKVQGPHGEWVDP